VYARAPDHFVAVDHPVDVRRIDLLLDHRSGDADARGFDVAGAGAASDQELIDHRAETGIVVGLEVASGDLGWPRGMSLEQSESGVGGAQVSGKQHDPITLTSKPPMGQASCGLLETANAASIGDCLGASRVFFHHP
jgi:hypothetical protein